MKKILFIGDVFGKPGRTCVKKVLPELKKELCPDITVANGENIASGMGINEKKYLELIEAGIDAVTLGNHSWHNKEFLKEIERCTKIVRPGNYPPGTPGAEKLVVNGVGIINMLGRVFMKEADCPFRGADRLISDLKKETNIILVDFHAEATSEKYALGWYLDGRASAVIGTHTHVQTSDERILPKGTAYITDAGMVGAYNSVIGVEITPIVEKFLTLIPRRFEPAKGGPLVFNAVLISADETTGRSVEIKRIFKVIEDPEQEQSSS